jgi:hypothetical protein
VSVRSKDFFVFSLFCLSTSEKIKKSSYSPHSSKVIDVKKCKTRRGHGERNFRYFFGFPSFLWETLKRVHIIRLAVGL